MASRQLSERGVEGACAIFAIWTLCSHAVVFAGGSLRALIALFAVALVATGALRWWLERRAPAVPAPAPPQPVLVADPATAWRWRLALGVVGLFVAFGLDPQLDSTVIWCALIVVLGAAALVFLLREEPLGEAPRRGRSLELGLWTLAAVCALYALAVNRPDQDDAFYVNVAVASVDHPELPLLARDTLHGHFDWPIHLPSYRLHSYELAIGALSLLSGVPPIYLFHLLAAPLFALAVPLAHAQLFRLLTPRVWLWSTLALVLVLALPGDAHRWYGNFAFVRMWQGKSILLSVLLPLVSVFALRFAQAPTRGSWLRLAGAQIAALGASASALWLAPAASLVALASVLRPRPRELRSFALGALASAYPIAAALGQMSGMRERAPQLADHFDPGVQLGRAFGSVLGGSWLLHVAVASLFVAWACWGRGLARRYAIAAPLAAALVLLSPWADAFVRANLTGPSYWRALWGAPIPILIALMLAAPLQWPGARGRIASVALMASFAGFVPQVWGFGAGNHARLGWPGLKVPKFAYSWAERIDALAPRTHVVAPPRISSWIPTFHQAAYPLAVRSYLYPLRDVIGEKDYRRRLEMTRLAEGDPSNPGSLHRFDQGLELYDVGLVCLRRGPQAWPLREILRAKGFRLQLQGGQVEVWLRGEPVVEPGAESP